MWLLKLFLRSSAKISLALYTYIFNTYVLPPLEVIMDFPVYSVYVLWDLFTVTIMRSVFLLLCSWLVSVFVYSSTIFLLVIVDLLLLLIFVRRTLILYSDLGNLLMSFAVSSGNVFK